VLPLAVPGSWFLILVPGLLLLGLKKSRIPYSATDCYLEVNMNAGQGGQGGQSGNGAVGGSGGQVGVTTTSLKQTTTATSTSGLHVSTTSLIVPRPQHIRQQLSHPGSTKLW